MASTHRRERCMLASYLYQAALYTIAYAIAHGIFNSLRARYNTDKITSPLQGTALDWITAGLLSLAVLGLRGIA